MVEVECTKNAVSPGWLLYLDTDFCTEQEHDKTSLATTLRGTSGKCNTEGLIYFLSTHILYNC